MEFPGAEMQAFSLAGAGFATGTDEAAGLAPAGTGLFAETAGVGFACEDLCPQGEVPASP